MLKLWKKITVTPQPRVFKASVSNDCKWRSSGFTVQLTAVQLPGQKKQYEDVTLVPEVPEVAIFFF